MPRFFKQDLLSKSELDPSHELEAPDDSPPNLAQDHPEQDSEDLLRTYLSWKAVSRPFRKRDRSFYFTIAILIVLIAGIAFFAGEIILIGVLLALGFLVYVLNFIPPEEVDYKISNQGVTIGDHFYHWQQMDSFWFSEKEGEKILNILTQLRFPGMLMLVLGETDQEEVKKVVAKFLPYHEIAPRSLIEKWSEGLQKHFPLETHH